MDSAPGTDIRIANPSWLEISWILLYLNPRRPELILQIVGINYGLHQARQIKAIKAKQQSSDSWLSFVTFDEC
jgi:hypothetical protein